MAAEPSSPTSRREILGLSVLFAGLYFVQGIAEPTAGLIAQPVQSLLNSRGYSTEEIARFCALLALPWSLKPLFGLLTDFVPLAGTRRRSYLLAATAATVVALLLLTIPPVLRGSVGLLFALLLLATTGVAVTDVVVDALMVEKGQQSGMTGRFQSIQWAAGSLPLIVTGSLGGYLSQHKQQETGFLICAVATAASFLLVLAFVREPRQTRSRDSLRGAIAGLWRIARSPAILAIGGFLFLWSFNPFAAEILYLHSTNVMRFSDQFYGHTQSFMGVSYVVASITYGLYCRRVPFRWLVHASILLGVLSTLAYWGMHDHTSAIVVTLAVGFTYMTALLIQLDLAAQVCPPEAAGTTFALLMALTNLSTSVATVLGGSLYERWSTQWGPHRAFHVLVGCGAAFTAGCWLLVPILRRHAPHWDRPMRADL